MSHITDYLPDFDCRAQFINTPAIPEIEQYGFTRDANGDYWNGLQIFYYSEVAKKFVFCRCSKCENEYFDSVQDFITFYTK